MKFLAVGADFNHQEQRGAGQSPSASPEKYPRFDLPRTTARLLQCGCMEPNFTPPNRGRVAPELSFKCFLQRTNLFAVSLDWAGNFWHPHTGVAPVYSVKAVRKKGFRVHDTRPELENLDAIDVIRTAGYATHALFHLQPACPFTCNPRILAPLTPWQALACWHDGLAF